MGRPSRLAGTSALLAAIALAAAGCGTARPHTGGQPGSGRTQPASSGALHGPAAGSRDLAERTSRELLRGLVLPRGSRPDRSRPLPSALRGAPDILASGHTLRRNEIFTVRHPAAWVLGYLRRHVPAGLTADGSGTYGDLVQVLTWTPRRLPAGLNEAELNVSILPSGPGVLVRADTEVIWYPPRSRAEFVAPARFAAVRLLVQVFNPRPHAVRQVFRSPAVIARLARTLDVLPADPGLQYACPAILATYRLTFVPRAAGQPQIVAVPDGCNSVSMQVGPTQQPDLTGGYATTQLMNRLLGLTDTGMPAYRRPTCDHAPAISVQPAHNGGGRCDQPAR